jgi:CHAT domain
MTQRNGILGKNESLTTVSNVLQIHAELRSSGRTVAVSTEGSSPVTAEIAALNFSTWQLWLGNQKHGDKEIWTQPDFEARIDEESARIGGLLDLESMQRSISSMDPAPTQLLVQIVLPHRGLDQLPWELLALCIEERYPNLEVCVFRSLERTERDREWVETEGNPSTIPMRVLLADSSPLTVHSTNFTAERKAIENGLQRVTLCQLIKPDERHNVSHLTLSKAMSPGQRLLHMSAHGQAGELILEEGLEHQSIGSRQFSELFRENPGTAATILSVCDSALSTNRLPSLAWAITEVGVPSVLAMYSAISQRAALAFFMSLYRSLGLHRDMLTAYGSAVATLRHLPYPNRGFWSVPVLYSQGNVIPFPRMPEVSDDPYEEHLEIAATSLSQVSRVLPQPDWSIEDWEIRTRRFRMVTGPRLRQDLEDLKGSIIPAARVSWGWAHDLTNTVRAILAALEHFDEVSMPPSAGMAAVTKFHEGRQDFINHLAELCRTLRALRGRQ